MLGRVIRSIKERIIAPPEFVPVTEAFLFSKECEALMSKHLPFPGVFDNHEAQNQTRNYLFRHHEVNHRLGVFRWRGIFKHRQLIIDAITGDDKLVVDFGGGASPLGFNSIIVDFLEKDAYGRQVKYRHVREVDQAVDVVFTSHTWSTSQLWRK